MKLGWLKIYWDKKPKTSPWFWLSFEIPVTPHKDSEGKVGMWIAYHNPHHPCYETQGEIGIYYGKYLLTINRKRIRLRTHHATCVGA